MYKMSALMMSMKITCGFFHQAIKVEQMLLYMNYMWLKAATAFIVACIHK